LNLIEKVVDIYHYDAFGDSYNTKNPAKDITELNKKVITATAITFF
jgi:hypothetical protein